MQRLCRSGAISSQDCTQEAGFDNQAFAGSRCLTWDVWASMGGAMAEDAQRRWSESIEGSTADAGTALAWGLVERSNVPLRSSEASVWMREILSGPFPHVGREQ